MELINYTEGMVFTINDKTSSLTNGRHNYVIVSTGIGEMEFVQAMCITSMRDKEITWELPIKFLNDYISYVNPLNIHSFTEDDISTKQYRGILTDTFISVKSFLQLCIDIYNVNAGFSNKGKEVKERYEKYVETFFDIYSSYKEYRNTEKKDYSRFGKGSTSRPFSNITSIATKVI